MLCTSAASSFAFCASLLGPFYCREKFDLIFVFEPSPITVGLPALVLKKLKSVPIIFWVQDLWPESLSATGAVQSEKILKMVETYKGGNYRAGQISACAQAIRPQGMRDVEITADDWSGYVKTLEDKYKTEKENSWMLINIARGLKYLRIT